MKMNMDRYGPLTSLLLTVLVLAVFDLPAGQARAAEFTTLPQYQAGNHVANDGQHTDQGHPNGDGKANDNNAVITTRYRFQGRDVFAGDADMHVPLEDKWSLELNAGSDQTRVERAIDIHGEDYRDSVRIGIGLNYRF